MARSTKNLTPEQAQDVKLKRRARRAARKARKARELGVEVVVQEDGTESVDRQELKRRLVLARAAAADARVQRMREDVVNLRKSADEAETYAPDTERRYEEALTAAVSYDGDSVTEGKALFDKADRLQHTLVGITGKVSRLRRRAQEIEATLRTEGHDPVAPDERPPVHVAPVVIVNPILAEA